MTNMMVKLTCNDKLILTTTYITNNNLYHAKSVFVYSFFAGFAPSYVNVFDFLRSFKLQTPSTLPVVTIKIVFTLLIFTWASIQIDKI